MQGFSENRVHTQIEQQGLARYIYVKVQCGIITVDGVTIAVRSDDCPDSKG